MKMKMRLLNEELSKQMGSLKKSRLVFLESFSLAGHFRCPNICSQNEKKVIFP